MNESAAQMLGCTSKDEIEGKLTIADFSPVVHPDGVTTEAKLDRILRALSTGETVIESWHMSWGGRQFPVLVKAKVR